jgi:hypothetical protein
LRKSDFIKDLIQKLLNRKTYLYQSLGEAYRTDSMELAGIIEKELELIDKCLDLHRNSLALLKLANVPVVLS